MSTNEPGLDLHERETRWAELEDIGAAIENLRLVRDAVLPAGPA